MTTKTTTKTTEKTAKTVKPVNAQPKAKNFANMLADAIKAQDKASKLWHECQKVAIGLAVTHRNVTALTQLVQAVYNAKAVRATDLVKYVMHLAGDVEGGEGCALVWIPKEKKFNLKPNANFRPDAIELSDSQAWFEWAKPESTKIEKFDGFFAQIKRMNKLIHEGKVVPTKDEAEYFAEINKLTVRKFGADKVQVAAKKA